MATSVRQRTASSDNDNGDDNGFTRAMRVVGRAFSTVWTVPKARFGLLLFGLIIHVAACAPILSP
ncbi:MAG: hypothetical protein L0K08_02365 [Bifidobacterium mongoliense]|nr:hypothetical protein [Bifidobacterium mongoliense]